MVSVQIPAQEMEAILKHAQELRQMLAPYLIGLTPEGRDRGLKMGNDSQPFVEKATEYAKTHAEFVPPRMEVHELEIDLKAVDDLTKVYREIDQLHRNLSDTVMQSGSEAFAEALAYYQAVKQAAKMGRPIETI